VVTRIPTLARPWTGRTALVSATMLAAAMLAGCGGDAGESGDASGPNDSDVGYATHVTSHHAQTLQVLDLTLGRPDVRPALADFAEGSRQELFSEVETTQKWLEDWGEPVPKTVLQHTHEEDPQYDTSAPGMLDESELHRLDELGGRRFDRAWVRDLIRLEKAAVEMARAALDSGEHAAVHDFAEKDLAFHRKQLQRLRDAAG
jgi:uncharacterized protein (DUF305 family)